MPIDREAAPAIGPVQEIVHRNYRAAGSGSTIRGIAATHRMATEEPRTDLADVDQVELAAPEDPVELVGLANPVVPAALEELVALENRVAPAGLASQAVPVNQEVLAALASRAALEQNLEPENLKAAQLLPERRAARTKLEIAAFHKAAVATPSAAVVEITLARAAPAAVTAWAAVASAVVVAAVECVAEAAAAEVAAAEVEVAEGKNKPNEDLTTYETKSYYNELNKDFLTHMCHDRWLDLR